jgi:DNA-binding CsgD family transcriptional regulator
MGQEMAALTPAEADLLQTAISALRSGNWAAARTPYEALVAACELPEAFEGLGTACRWLHDERATFAAFERAFALYRSAGRRRDAARVAMELANDCVDFRGEWAVSKGWLARARRLLDGIEACAETAWLRNLEGYTALMERNDTLAARAAAVEAAALAGLAGSEDMVAWARALEGLAMVSAGDVDEGMRLLDEAVAEAAAGEVADVTVRGTISCYLFDACGRVRDFDRAAQWWPRMRGLFTDSGLQPLTSLCRPNYALMLIWSGDWASADSELQIGIRELSETRAPLVGESIVRLAELRCRQGKVEEAEALFHQVSGDPLCQLGLARLALMRGEAGSAVELCERYLRRMPADARAERATGLETMVPALVGAGRLEEAEGFAKEMTAIAMEIGTPAFTAAAAYTGGLVALAAGDAGRARRAFEDAIDISAAAGGRFEATRARVELAQALAVEGRLEAARKEAARSLGEAQRMGAAPLGQRADALLRALAGKSRGHLPGGLTSRETEILGLVARGLSNQEIAQALVVSVRTIERHLSNIYLKLGLVGPSARAGAAAWATREGLAPAAHT